MSTIVLLCVFIVWVNNHEPFEVQQVADWTVKFDRNLNSGTMGTDSHRDSFLPDNGEAPLWEQRDDCSLNPNLEQSASLMRCYTFNHC